MKITIELAKYLGIFDRDKHKVDELYNVDIKEELIRNALQTKKQKSNNKQRKKSLIACLFEILTIISLKREKKS